MGYTPVAVQDEADISGNIVVYRKTVWKNNPSDIMISSQICWKNLKTHKSGTVSSSSYKQHDPAISGTRVVWDEYRSGKSYVYVKNIATGAFGRVGGSNSYNPDISGTRMVWEQTIGSHSYIYYKNLATGYSGKVQSSNYKQNNPAISGTRVVWDEYRSYNTYVYVKNIATGAIGRLGSNHASHPDISGNKVVWQDNNSIYWRDLVTRAGGKLYRGNVQYRPKISGSKVVWQDYYGKILAVYVKNLVTGSVFRVIWQNGDSQFGYDPAISGTIVVFQNWKTHYIVPNPFFVYWKDILTGAGGRVQV